MGAMQHGGRYALAEPLRLGLERKEGTPNVSAEVKKLFDDFQTAFGTFKEKNDAALAELKSKGVTDVVLTEHVDRINAKLTEMQTNLDKKLIEAKRPIVKQTDGTEREMSADEVEHRKAFNHFFRKGGNEHDLRAIEQKALSAGSNPDGGYLVPTQVETEMVRVITDVSPFRPLAQVITISTGSLTKPVNLTGANSGWVAEQQTRPVTNNPQLAQLTFVAHEMYAMPGATQTLLDDAFVNIEEWLANEVRIEFARAEGAAFVNGNGVAKPYGFMAQTFVANASYAWGTPGYIATGVSGDFAAAPAGADALIDLIYALKPEYRGRAHWIMAKASIARARKLKDSDGAYLWQPGMQLGQPASVLGYALTEAEDMPAFGADTFPIALGDWKSSYLIVDRIGTRVLRDPFTSKPFVLFYTTRRVGGGVQNYEAYKVLKAGTS